MERVGEHTGKGHDMREKLRDIHATYTEFLKIMRDVYDIVEKDGTLNKLTQRGISERIDRLPIPELYEGMGELYKKIGHYFINECLADMMAVSQMREKHLTDAELFEQLFGFNPKNKSISRVEYHKSYVVIYVQNRQTFSHAFTSGSSREETRDVRAFTGSPPDAPVSYVCIMTTTYDSDTRGESDISMYYGMLQHELHHILFSRIRRAEHLSLVGKPLLLRIKELLADRVRIAVSSRNETQNKEYGEFYKEVIDDLFETVSVYIHESIANEVLAHMVRSYDEDRQKTYTETQEYILNGQWYLNAYIAYAESLVNEALEKVPVAHALPAEATAYVAKARETMKANAITYLKEGIDRIKYLHEDKKVPMEYIRLAFMLESLEAWSGYTTGIVNNEDGVPRIKPTWRVLLAAHLAEQRAQKKQEKAAAASPQAS